VLAAGVVLVLSACGGGSSSPTSGSGGTGGGSSPQGSSHNFGRNCLQCHGFSAAGSVAKASGAGNTGTTVRLTTAPNGGGSVIATLRTDGTGNFYTSQSISYANGLYAEMTGAGGTTVAMKAAITNGGCNSCHGVSTTRLTID
jgi:hypothetical protein